MWGFDYGMAGNEGGVRGEDRAALDVLHRAVGAVWTQNEHLRALNLLSTLRCRVTPRRQARGSGACAALRRSRCSVR